MYVGLSELLCVLSVWGSWELCVFPGAGASVTLSLTISDRKFYFERVFFCCLHWYQSHLVKVLKDMKSKFVE